AGTDYTLQTSFIGIGSILAAALSGVLAQAIGYRGVFTLSGLLLLICMVLITTALPSSHPQPSQVATEMIVPQHRER
ncbi:MAG: MFS transporter, partial [Cyanobacteria bacterium P01_F01_bin.86]